MAAINSNGFNDSEKNQSRLLNELQDLRHQVNHLEIVQLAFNLQTEILQKAVQIAKCEPKSSVLRATLAAILEATERITGAEEGSIFLVDDEGRVIEGILSSPRGEIRKGQAQKLIGQVIYQGLAGSVLRSRSVGLIADTAKDSHWINLPDQPYAVRSALGVPLLYSNLALGVLTLMHSQANHFTDDHATLMRMSHDQLALITEHARLFSNS